MSSTRDAEAAPSQAPGRSIYIAIFGLMLGMFLAMLDNLIVGTALPTIVGDLGGIAHLSWVVTAYTLATAASTPIWGKLGDLYGRKGMFMSAIVIFLIGSMLSGLSQNMGQLIGFRAIQGLGAGGLMVGAFAIIGDLVPPRERGRIQGIVGGMMPIAFVGGPLLGGFLTDHFTWRWAFYVNVPIGAAALLVTGLGMRLHTPHVKAKIDYLGALLLTVGIVSLTLVASWGGSEYPWRSAQIISLAVVAVATLAVFGYAEARVAEPILPPRLFGNRNFTVAQLLSFLVGAAMFGTVNFLPQYMQDVQGASATASGLLMLPLMFGMLAVMLTCGQLILRNGRYRAYPIMGGAVMTVGMLVMLLLKVNTSTAVSSALTVVVGVGMGFLMQNTTLITQNSVELRDMGAASGSVTLFRTIGGSLGVALLGSIFTTRLKDDLTNRLGAQAGNRVASGGTHVTPAILQHLPAPVREAFEAGVTSGLHGALIGGAVVSFIGFAIAWLVREVPLRGRGKEPTPKTATAVPVNGRYGPLATSPGGRAKRRRRRRRPVRAPLGTRPATAGSGTGLALAQPSTNGHRASNGVSPAAAHNGTAQAAGALNGHMTSLSGLVHDGAGAPVPEAVITVTGLDGRQLGRTRTGPDGRYRIETEPGDHLVIVSAPGRSPCAVTLPAGDAEAVRDFALPTDQVAPAGEIRGVVRSSAGEPLAGITTTVTDESGEVVAATVSGDDGGYRVSGLNDGNYTLVAAGNRPGTAEVEVNVGEAATVRVDLGK